MREHTVNLGNYESLKIGASVETEVDDVNELVMIDLDAKLDTLLAADKKEAIALLPAGSTSYIQSWRVDA
jgi:hypothetical protein